jgi:hypothetical protein
LPCPGTDNDAKGFVLVTAPSHLETGVNDTRPGLITFPQNVNNGYIQGIYPTYTVKSGDKFNAIVNCEYGASSCYVVFRLDYSIAGSSSIQTLWAFVERYEGQYYTANVDLTSLVGKDVKFILTVLSTGASAGDRALWVAPVLYNSGSAPVVPATATPSFTSTLAPATAATTAVPATTIAPTTAVPTTAVATISATATTPVPSETPTLPASSETPTLPAPTETPTVPVPSATPIP